MSDSFSPHVSGTDGAVHTGSGDLYISYGESPNAAYVRTPRRHNAEQLMWLRRHFVYPSGFGEAREVLDQHRVVFVDAPPGSGRIATSKMLLWERRQNAEELHEILRQDQEPWLHEGQISDGDLAWLDLTEVDKTLWPALVSDLSPLYGTAHERDAYLAVALPWRSGNLPPELDRCRVTIAAPPAAAVLHRYLMMAGVPRSTSLASLPFLRTNPALEVIAKYARLITKAWAKAPGKGDLDTWSDDAEKAMSGWADEIAQLVSGLQDGPQRALLLATAMLHGAHSDAIHSVTMDFLKSADHPPDDRSLLTQPPLDQRLAEIKAGTDSHGRVRFDRLEFDREVCSYCWSHLPGLRDPIRVGVARSLGSADLSDDEKTQLVQCFTRLCLEPRYQRLWTSLVLDWTSPGSTARQVKAAATVLQEGLQDDQRGRIFRRQIYDWARSPDLPDGLAAAIVEACRDQMMINHPDEALVRLHHVARHEKRTLARKTLSDLVSEDHRHLRRLLNRLIDPQSAPLRWPIDIRLFLEIIDPQPLVVPTPRGRPIITETTVNRQLVTGWKRAFTNIPQGEWSRRARQWLVLAAENERCRDALLDVLVAGAEGCTETLAAIFHLTHADGRLRADIGGLVMQKINRAQGLPLP